jgi:hypothetical protein
MNAGEFGFASRVCVLRCDGVSAPEMTADAHSWKYGRDGRAFHRLTVVVKDSHPEVGSLSGCAHDGILPADDSDG